MYLYILVFLEFGKTVFLKVCFNRILGLVSGEQLEYQNYKKQKEKEDKRKPVKKHTSKFKFV